jgi:hypothetical protein
MNRAPIKAILTTAACAALLGGCATTLETGPGYYRYDSHVAGATPPPTVYHDSVVVTPEPSTYHDPGVVYLEPSVTYRYRAGSPTYYHDHGQ